jgi:membrane protein DedA with SNARE-associated domain/rhodanese-related sulfurtransferase
MQQLVGLLNHYGIALVFGWVLLTRLGLPVPAVPLIVVAGSLTVSGRLAVADVLAASMLGNLLAESVWFQVGRRFGYRGLNYLCRLSLSPDLCVRQSETVVGRWGGLSLVAAKFIPGVSLLAAPMAGALRMRPLRFVAFQLAGAALWTLAYLLPGRWFSRQIAHLLGMLADAGTVASLALVLAIVLWLALRYWRRQALRKPGIARVSVAELRELMASGTAPIVIDVRSAAGRQVDNRRIPGALAIELEHIESATAAFARDSHVVLYCNCPNELSAAKAAERMAAQGFHRARPLAGGLEAWEAALPAE